MIGQQSITRGQVLIAIGSKCLRDLDRIFPISTYTAIMDGGLNAKLLSETVIKVLTTRYLKPLLHCYINSCIVSVNCYQSTNNEIFEPITSLLHELVYCERDYCWFIHLFVWLYALTC